MLAKFTKQELKDEYKTQRLALKEAYEQSLRTLFGTGYVALLDELELLESQIELAEGEALENLKTAILNKEAQIKTLRLELEATYAEEFGALKEQYETDKKALINNYIDEVQAQVETLRANLQNRIGQNESKLELRRQFAKTRLNNFANKYETFKALRESDLFNFLKTQIENTDRLSLEVKEDLINAINEAQKYSKLYQD